MAFDFLSQGRASKQFLGLFRPEENQTQDNTMRPGQNSLDANPLNYETPMMDLYKKQLESMPDESNYHSGKLAKILAFGAGALSGSAPEAYKTTKGILDEPYEHDLNAWKQKTGTTGELASLEERTQANKAKNILDWYKFGDEHANTMSNIGHRTKQDEEIDARIPTIGRFGVENKIGGTHDEYDRNGKLVVSVKDNETPDQISARHFTDYKNEKGYDFINDQKLIGARRDANEAEHRVNGQWDIDNKLPAETNKAMDLEEFKNGLTQSNIELQHSFDRTSPEQQNAALAGAFAKVKLENPEYNQFFDAAGNIDPKVVANNPEAYDNFKALVGREVGVTLGNKKDIPIGPKARPNRNVSSGNPLSPKGSQPTPKVVSDEDAKKELIKRGKAITPESIAKAKQLLGGS